jgi:hypothetical protein
MHAMKANRELKELFHLFLTSALDGVSVQLHAAREGHPVPTE